MHNLVDKVDPTTVSITLEEGQSAVLLALCHAQVLSALETVGKRIVKKIRERYKLVRPKGFHRAHTMWDMSESEVSQALKGAWTHVPTLLKDNRLELEPTDVSSVLDSLVRDLVITGTEYHIAELQYRLESRLLCEVSE